jgi:hypothetical protein
VRARGRARPTHVLVDGRELGAAASGTSGRDGWWHDSDGAWVRLRRPVSAACEIVISAAAVPPDPPHAEAGGSGRVFREQGGELLMQAGDGRRRRAAGARDALSRLSR